MPPKRIGCDPTYTPEQTAEELVATIPDDHLRAVILSLGKAKDSFYPEIAIGMAMDEAGREFGRR